MQKVNLKHLKSSLAKIMSNEKFKIRVPENFEKKFNKLKLSKKVVFRIEEKIKTLESKPYNIFSPDISKSVNPSLPGCYILRAGNYRIFYDINSDSKEVILLTIEHRSKAYK